MFSAIKSFVHSLTTEDHYASYDPNRANETSGQDQPLTTEYPSYPRASFSSRNSSSANLSYTQGSRSQQLNSPRGSSVNLSNQSQHGSSSGLGSIPLEDVSESNRRPIPSPSVSWQRIDEWVEQNYPELYDQLQDGCTSADLRELEHDLDCHLPQDVCESFKEHDGQERGGKPTGLLYGITLLDMNSVTDEWTVWRNTAVRLNSLQGAQATQNRQELAERQRSCPAEAVQTVYAHPGWIPLAKDFNGNNIGVDMAPGPRGTVGQVILFGRDFDVKYVIAPSWGHFLDAFATDLECGNSFVDDDIEDAVFAYKLPSGRLASYLEILRSRVARSARQPAADQRMTSTATKEEIVMKLTPAKIEKQMEDVKLDDKPAAPAVVTAEPVTAEPVAAEPVTETATEEQAEDETEATSEPEDADPKDIAEPVTAGQTSAAKKSKKKKGKKN